MTTIRYQEAAELDAPTTAVLDVVIVGGGIVGLSCALALQKRGKRVALIDPGDARRGASFGSAGVLGRGSILPFASPSIWPKLARYVRNADPGLRIRYSSLPSLMPFLWQFARRANATNVREAAAALDPLVSRAYDAHVALARDIGGEHLIRRNGWMRLYRSAASFAATTFERDILRQFGVDVLALSPGEIAELEPGIAPRFAGGLFFPQTGSVETPGDLLALYLRAFSSRGGLLVAGNARKIAQTETGVVVQSDDRVVSADQAVVAAGAWSGELARSLGYRVPLVAERGYHRHFRLTGNAGLSRPVNDVAGGYVVAPMGETVRIVSGIELARIGDPPAYAQIEQAIGEARLMLPLAPEPIDEPWCGNRPATPDGLPVIGRAPRHDRIVFAFGHGHIGFSNGPITGTIVADEIDRLPPICPLEAYRVERFKSG